LFARLSAKCRASLRTGRTFGGRGESVKHEFARKLALAARSRGFRADDLPRWRQRKAGRHRCRAV